MWVYRRVRVYMTREDAEKSLYHFQEEGLLYRWNFEVGYFGPLGDFMAIADYERENDAQNEVHFLNGGDRVQESHYMGGAR